MNIEQVSYPDLAFVDIETTGSHFDRDRITEIGIKTLAKQIPKSFSFMCSSR